jgi:hypothetical protein
MSKKNETNETNKETKGGKSRRDFLRNSALGAAGLMVGLHLTKAERVLARMASRHATDFFAKAREVVPNDIDQAAFRNVFSEVNAMIESNPQFRENANRIFSTLADNGPFDFTRPLTNLGLHTDTTNLAAAGYLGALSGLRERSPSRDLITNVLSDPSYINQFIEAGFINSLYKKANEEVSSNGEYSRNSGSATSQMSRLAPDREPCTVPTYVNGQYVGETPCWVVVVVVVIVVIVIIATKL